MPGTSLHFGGCLETIGGSSRSCQNRTHIGTRLPPWDIIVLDQSFLHRQDEAGGKIVHGNCLRSRGKPTVWVEFLHPGNMRPLLPLASPIMRCLSPFFRLLRDIEVLIDDSNEHLEKDDYQEL